MFVLNDISALHFLNAACDLEVDLTKLRLNDSTDPDGGSLTDPLISPDQEDYALVRGQVMRGFCCASFPLAKGLARTIKRL